MMEENRIESIERYLEGKMTEAERAAFEQQLYSDSKLAAEVDQLRKADEIVRYANQKDLKDRLTAIDSEGERQKPRRWHLKQLAIAASVLVLIVAGVYVFNLSDHDNDTRLSMSVEEIAVDFHSPATINQMRSNSSDGVITFSERLATADSIFASGNYSEAYELYTALATESNPQSQKADWNMVLADLAVGNSRYQADLNRISSDKTHLFNDKAIELKAVLASK